MRVPRFRSHLPGLILVPVFVIVATCADALVFEVLFENGQSEIEALPGASVRAELWLETKRSDGGISAYHVSVSVPSVPPFPSLIQGAEGYTLPGLPPFLANPREIVQPGPSGEPGYVLGFANGGPSMDVGPRKGRFLIGVIDLQITCGDHLISSYFTVQGGVLNRSNESIGDLAVHRPGLIRTSAAGCGTQVMLGISNSVIESGATARLTWLTVGVTDCRATGTWTPTLSWRGEVTVFVTQDSIFGLICVDLESGEEIHSEVELRVITPPSILIWPLVDPQELPSEQVPVRWEATNADVCAYRAGDGSYVLAPPVGEGIFSRDLAVQPLTGPVSIGCYANGSPIFRYAEASVPSFDYDLSPVAATAGEVVELTWEPTGGPSCWVVVYRGDDFSDFEPLVDTSIPDSGHYSILAEPDDVGDYATRFRVRLTCGGSHVLASFTVRHASSVDLAASARVIAAGDPVELSWISVDTSQCLASGGWEGVRLMSGSELVTPTSTTTYGIECASTRAVAPAEVQPMSEAVIVYDAVTVEVASPGAPVNDQCALAESFISDRVFELDTSMAQASPTDPIASCGNGPDGATVWFAYAPEEEGAAWIEAASDDYDIVLSVWELSDPSCDEAVREIACSDGEPGAPAVSIAVSPGQRYYVQVGSRNGGAGGALTLSVVPEPGPLVLGATVVFVLAHLSRRRAVARALE